MQQTAKQYTVSEVIARAQGKCLSIDTEGKCPFNLYVQPALSVAGVREEG
jgi:hypothetical protein